jgi:hypothetical protein
LAKSLHEKINYEVKKAVAVNVFAATHRVVEPIFIEHFERDPERNIPVLENINKVAQGTKANSFKKKHYGICHMEFDLGKKLFNCSLKKKLNNSLWSIGIISLPPIFTGRLFSSRRWCCKNQINAWPPLIFAFDKQK